jgi:hypothetical protein
MGNQQVKQVKQVKQNEISDLDYCVLCKTYLLDRNKMGKKEIGAYLTDRRYIKIPNIPVGELYCNLCEAKLCTDEPQRQLCESINQLRSEENITQEDEDLLRQLYTLGTPPKNKKLQSNVPRKKKKLQSNVPRSTKTIRK